jgi:hypothetical protein
MWRYELISTPTLRIVKNGEGLHGLKYCRRAKQRSNVDPTAADLHVDFK